MVIAENVASVRLSKKILQKSAANRLGLLAVFYFEEYSIAVRLVL